MRTASLNVMARELRTGKETSIEVKPSYGLTDEEVEQMLIESFELAEEDIARRQLVDARVEADQVLLATEKLLPDAEAFAREGQLTQPRAARSEPPSRRSAPPAR